MAGLTIVEPASFVLAVTYLSLRYPSLTYPSAMSLLAANLLATPAGAERARV
jgi:hypothetical protein